jgi:hypothetical protein
MNGKKISIKLNLDESGFSDSNTDNSANFII